MKVQISNTLKDKCYFWYLYRCLKIKEKEGVISLIEKPSVFFEEPYYETILINDYPVFFDLRDDFNVTKDLKQYSTDYVLFKANFSSELWNSIKNGHYPDGFEYKLADFELDSFSHIRPFALGRMFKMHWEVDEIAEFRTQLAQDKTFLVVAQCGAGILKLQTISRLYLFDLISKELGNQCKLMFYDREHFQEKHLITNYKYYLNKYKNNIDTHSYKQYLRFLSSGKYSINVPGIALSTPFRFVDSIIANQAIITTKVWHDIYQNFPAVQLPICGYLGEGDWAQTERIIKDLNNIDYNKLVNDSHSVYSWFLSPSGMWNNQILKGLNK